MGQLLRVLIVEDSQDDAFFLQQALRHAGYELDCKVVCTPGAMRSELENQNWNIITSDHSMPGFSAPEALAIAKGICPDVPFIIVSGEIDLNLAVSLMRGGAKDYIQKHELARLAPAIERELREVELRCERQRGDRALVESNERFRTLIDAAPIAIALSRHSKFLYVNPAYLKMHGLTAEDEIIGHSVYERVAPESRAQSEERAYRRQNGLPVEKNYEYMALRKDGSSVRTIAAVARVNLEDGPATVGFFQEITDRKQAEE
jgi:PAS domain S-box-containing protein